MRKTEDVFTSITTVPTDMFSLSKYVLSDWSKYIFTTTDYLLNMDG